MKEDITKLAKEFYEQNPFPGYDGVETISDLKDRVTSPFYLEIDREMGDSVSVLELGCGTGQLCNFLGINESRQITGIDLSHSSLKLARNFRNNNNLMNVEYWWGDLFNLGLRERFDYVICTGVLHHTDNPFMGFQKAVDRLKSGGTIIIGVYNKYGRFFTNLRRKLFKIIGNRASILDYRLCSDIYGSERKKIWFEDQYRNPYESSHTFGEVLHWFDFEEIDFIKSSPEFKSKFTAQLKLVFTGVREGGFFIMVGRKR